MKTVLNTKVKDVKAITLIALIVTIVVLLIISTVAITLLVNNNIMNQAKLATDRYNNSIDREDYELARLNNEIDGLSSTRADVQAANNPVGTVISCIRDSAPDGYLACDGTEYDITQYPELAEELRKVYNGYNTTTEGKFKVPDLRGEFLRGTGSSGRSYTNGGAAIGQHQNPTYHKWIASDGNAIGATQNDGLSYQDWNDTGGPWNYARSGIVSGSGWVSHYTSRPTNTSVLYCIKY